MNRKNKKSSALLFVLLAIAVLTILGAAFVSRSISESHLAQRNLEFTQAFWLAEAGVSSALKELRADPYLAVGTVLGTAQYRFTLLSKTDIAGVQRYTIKAEGCIPNGCNFALPNFGNLSSCRIIRALEAVFTKYEFIPSGFYDNAIYSAGNVTIGSNCPVTGNVFSGGVVNGIADGDVTQNDPVLSTNGLPTLNFSELRQTSIDQGWYNPNTHTTEFPTGSFYYSPGVPNVVFVEGDFSIVGGKEVVKGFVVVGGDTVYDAEIGGNASVDGCVYTRGNIWLHGGGGPNILNVNGGVWAGGTVLMNGNEEIKYNKEYMDAIKNGLHPNTDIKITAWQDTQNPYTVSP
ncbi:MAG: hypothetical protein WC412_04680 [Candidatus Omnitrophota bacterium]|jgi:hypothetical protein